MITKTKHLLKIGELAAQSRVSAQAIRYYEELGLLQSSDRTVGAYLTATTANWCSAHQTYGRNSPASDTN